MKITNDIDCHLLSCINFEKVLHSLIPRALPPLPRVMTGGISSMYLPILDLDRDLDLPLTMRDLDLERLLSRAMAGIPLFLERLRPRGIPLPLATR